MSFVPGTRSLKAHGVVGVVLVALVVGVALGAYQQAFTSSVTVQVIADRSGLLMDEGADVRLRGIKIGRVSSVKPGPDGTATIELKLNPDDANRVPADTEAELLPATVFGGKNVHLTPADGPVVDAIAEGDRIETRQITSEANDVFMGLQDVLTRVKPSRLNATLGALAASLDGRGTRIGESVTGLNDYLTHLNPSLDALHTDLSSGAQVADEYAAVAPDVLAIARNLTVTAATLNEQEPALRALLLGLSSASKEGKELMTLVQGPLVNAMHQLEPTSALLARYSPEIVCVVKGLNEVRRRLDAGLQTGFQARAGVIFAQESYKYPRDLPTFATGNGPHCLGLPYISDADMPSPRYLFDDGIHNLDHEPGIRPSDDPVKVFTELLGPLPDGFGAQ